MKAATDNRFDVAMPLGAVRKCLMILAVIMVLEAVPWVLTLVRSGAGVTNRLYGFHAGSGPAWIAAAIVATGYILYAVQALPLVGRHFFDVSAIKLIALPFAIVTGTMEELWFRKLLMDSLANHGEGSVVQVAMAAIVFGLAHGIWGLFGRRWAIAVGATVATGTLGGLLGVVYLLGGRDVAPCIWAHLVINLAIEPWLMLAAVAGGSTMRRTGLQPD